MSQHMVLFLYVGVCQHNAMNNILLFGRNTSTFTWDPYSECPFIKIKLSIRGHFLLLSATLSIPLTIRTYSLNTYESSRKYTAC